MTTPTRRSALRSFTVAAVLVAMLAAGCGVTVTPGPSSTTAPSPAGPVPTGSAATPTTVPSPTPAPSPTLSRIDGWRADVDALLVAREQIHPDPWHGMPRAQYVAAADEVKARIPTMSDDQALVALVRLAAMPGWAGRDGHTGMFPFTADSGTHEFPIRLWQFRDGMFITTARAPYEDLVGARIVAINDHPIKDVLDLVEPLSPRDNPSNLLAYAPLYLRVSELLTGLGIQEQVGPATFNVIDADGNDRDVDIAPIPAADDVDVAWRTAAAPAEPGRHDVAARHRHTAVVDIPRQFANVVRPVQRGPRRDRWRGRRDPCAREAG